MSLPTSLGAAMIRYIAGDYSGARAECASALELEPRAAGALYIKGMSEHLAGNSEDALESFRQSEATGVDHPAVMAGRILVLMALNRRDEAVEVLSTLRERATRSEVSPYDFAEAYIAFGDRAKAYEYLRRSYDLRLPELTGIAADPFFAELRNEGMFKALVTSLGLGDASAESARE